MKRFFHLLAIFLFALLVAGWYEIYYIRGGQLPDINPIDSLVQQRWGRSSMLWFDRSDKQDGQDSDTWSELAAIQPDDGDVEPDNTIPTSTTNTLIEEYSVWTVDLASLQAIGVVPNDTFSVIQYCEHSSELCQDAHDQDVLGTLSKTLLPPLAVHRRPFVSSLDGIDATIRLGESCVSDDQLDEYHDQIYTDTPTTLRDLVIIAKQLNIDDFETCIQEWSARWYISQQMKQANALFGVTRIPSYVILDHSSDQRYSIPWLYTQQEIEEFLESEIE